MSDPTWPQMPGALVVARFARVHGDGTDVDERPDWIAPVGTELTFTPSITGTLVYDPAGAKIIIELAPFHATVDADGYAVARDGGHPIRLAPTNDPLMSRTGWLWTCSWAGGKVSFPAPSSGAINLADFIVAPPGNPVVEEWVARIPELFDAATAAAAAGPIAVDAAAVAVEARDTATDAASTATDAASTAAAARDEAQAAAAAIRSTGWRDFTQFLRAGFTKSASAGACRFRREGEMVEFEIRVALDAAAAQTQHILDLPAGFLAAAYVPVGPLRAGPLMTHIAIISTTSTLSAYATITGGATVEASGRFRTSSGWPAASALPGVQITPPNYS